MDFAAAPRPVLLQIRVGLPREPAYLAEVREEWPEKVHHCGYVKAVLNEPAVVTEDGLVGNAAGYPSHVEDHKSRAVLVFNELTYQHLLEYFPTCTESFVSGGFAENFVVNCPTLLPSSVCIGDRFRIGSAEFCVTGPRFPCPKVDAWHRVSGLKAKTLENGWAGYFLKVIHSGTCSAGDEIILLDRPHPGYTVQRIAQGLWGPEESRDNSTEFLRYLSENMTELMERHFRSTASTRLNRILCQN